MTLQDIRESARALFLNGVRAADPAEAVKRELTAKPIVAAPNGLLFIIGFGKAACAMMEQVFHHVPDGQQVRAIAVTNDENARDLPGCIVRASGHPLPDQRGLDAGREIMELLKSATKDDQVLCLISGGGSALLPSPRDGITLADKIAISEQLLQGGLDIAAMNVIRQQLSVLKGGGLVEMAFPAPVRSLVISDVVGDDIRVIASGPTAPALDGHATAVTDMQRLCIWEKLPVTAQNLLRGPRPVTPYAADNSIICSNSQSLQAIAASATDWDAKIVSHQLVGDVDAAAHEIVKTANLISPHGRQLLIWGGETTVNITGTGMGGRNQELALRVASLASGISGKWAFLSGGTDGRDGPTDAAGGLVTPQTLSRAKSLNIDVPEALEDNDSYRVLKACGDLLMIGATGTNVADIQLLFRVQD